MFVFDDMILISTQWIFIYIFAFRNILSITHYLLTSQFIGPIECNPVVFDLQP